MDETSGRHLLHPSTVSRTPILPVHKEINKAELLVLRMAGTIAE
jgi:hypothetical protein